MTGHHENLIADEHVRPPSEKSFGLTFAVVFALLAAWLWWRGHPVGAGAAGVASAACVACAYLAPAALRPLNLVWLKFGLLLHKVVNPIIMGGLFFLVFTPMGYVMRRAGKDFLGLKRNPEATSYWVRRDATLPLGSMKKQF
ncbi:SxtJ family membrane protein [Methylopila henanensis]|uniref:SxtJ family membrane protein n=1 Tax=Methylopila henanensis TaxID=873516 RepID=A0ABW4K0T9_9HYPH